MRGPPVHPGKSPESEPPISVLDTFLHFWVRNAPDDDVDEHGVLHSRAAAVAEYQPLRSDGHGTASCADPWRANAGRRIAASRLLGHEIDVSGETDEASSCRAAPTAAAASGVRRRERSRAVPRPGT